MEFELVCSRDGDILVVLFSGRVTEHNVSAMVARYFDIVRAEQPGKVLADTRPLLGRLAFSEIYVLVRNLPKLSSPAPKTAYLTSEEQREDGQFLETAAHNVGVELKAFVDRDVALTWLRSV